MSAAGGNKDKSDKEQDSTPQQGASGPPLSRQRPAHVIVHPLVLLSVVDHYNRVAKDTRKRVVGVLLGTRSKMDPSGKTREETTEEEKEDLANASADGRLQQGADPREEDGEDDVGNALTEGGEGQTVVDITNAFAVPFEEDTRDSSIWYLDHNFLEDMYSMFRKVNSKEKIVGFYSSGPKIKPADIQIDQLFQDYCEHPVMVIVDVRPTVEGIPTQAYISKEIVKEGKETQRTFEHLGSSIGASDPEEIGVEHLLRDVNDPSVSDLAAELKHKLLGLRGLHERLGEIKNYLDNVLAGRLPPNNDILYNLQNIFNLLPNLTSKTLVESLHRTNNDMHLVLYMNSMVRAVLALHDLIGNKLKYREQDADVDFQDSDQSKQKTEKSSEDSAKKPLNS